MLSCHDLKLNEVYACPECGLELTVTRECKDARRHTAAGDCCTQQQDCNFVCCGQQIQKKQ